MRKFRFRLFACGLLLITTIAAPAVAANRLALVIGNAQYGKEPLLNPINDANAMTSKLTALGFQVTKHLELRRDEIGVAMDNFLSGVSPGDNVVFFYAGHGVQFDGENYLLSSDAKIRSQNDVPRNSISVSRFLKRLDATRAAVKIVFLDACRNNPFASTFRGSASRGLARIGGAPSGTLISFATQPGGLADDGERANGLYTEQLIAHIGTPGMAVEQVLKQVAKSTFTKSNGRQRPWIEGSLLGDFVFNPAKPTDVRPAVASADDEYESQAWQLANESGSVRLLEIFIREYPQSRRAPIARLKIASLKSAGGDNRNGKEPSSATRPVPRPVDTVKPATGSVPNKKSGPVNGAQSTTNQATSPKVSGPDSVLKPSAGTRYTVTVSDYSLEVEFTGTRFDIISFINLSSLYIETEEVSCRSWTRGNVLTVSDAMRFDQTCADENLVQTTGGDVHIVGTFPEISINGSKGRFLVKR